MDSVISPPDFYVEALTPNVTVFGDKAFKEVMEVKYGPKGTVLIQKTWCSYQKRNRCQAVSLPGEKAAIGKPRRELSPGPDHGDTLILHFQPPELEENSLLVKPSVYGILLGQPLTFPFWTLVTHLIVNGFVCKGTSL